MERAAQEAPADEQSGETRHVAVSNADEAQMALCQLAWIEDGGEIQPHRIETIRRALSRLAALAAEPGEAVAWLDDGSLRAGSHRTAHRVVTDQQKRDMPSAVAASFVTPLYTRPALARPLPFKEEVERVLAKLTATHTSPVARDYDAARALLSRIRAGAQEGWKLVPEEPTEGMLLAAFHAAEDHLLNGGPNDHLKTSEERSAHAIRPIYRAMLAAAPSPEAKGGRS